MDVGSYRDVLILILILTPMWEDPALLGAADLGVLKEGKKEAMDEEGVCSCQPSTPWTTTTLVLSFNP